ncbi:TSUP family transporter [Albidovulum sp.]|uniref:TSUP family transporter n=1 Tax=Albidovulum sp. TaxID=1872424 RepID=UPI001D9F2BD2|nr:sulfite exporter TauE/SafE family protein [Paracoccaceae bacterium]MCC0047305.1 sulfite exporter TauE/SafE family protein [Defluviimonas sp.]HPE26086.1 sulfite exporter TauE/SafE family protein [Albidovulum sp.]MCB2140595.1 sulfite exporter TauE/SafE family protein [Paracoccaceae bacterium]MCB2158092.1 sulfite exporter TauE/SafE family protein [Paracoccaceae bacterium]
MTAALAEALATEGLWRLFAAVLLGGLVRGFAGFGGALIYMPAAATVLPPVWALITLTLIDIAGPVPNLPGAWANARRREVAVLLAGAVLALPLGVWTLSRLPAEPFRWGLSAFVILLLGLMMLGWRYRGRVGDALVAAIGVVGGFLGGLTGMAGPPVIVFYMAAGHAPVVMRANLLVFFLAVDLLVLATLALSGRLEAVPVAIAVLLAPLYMLANIAGGRLFRPEHARAYRFIAYGAISLSALVSLPLWD